MKKFNIQVRVRLKDGILNPEVEAISKALQRLDFKSISELKTEKLFHFVVDAENEGQAIEIGRKSATQLLANVVMEDFEVEIQ